MRLCFAPLLREVDEGVFLTFAGISADGRVLASKIRLECQNYRYGMGVAPSMGYIARYIGEGWLKVYSSVSLVLLSGVWWDGCEDGCTRAGRSHTRTIDLLEKQKK